jgi:hypothetical protein
VEDEGGGGGNSLGDGVNWFEKIYYFLMFPQAD